MVSPLLAPLDMETSCLAFICFPAMAQVHMCKHPGVGGGGAGVLALGFRYLSYSSGVGYTFNIKNQKSFLGRHYFLGY